MKFIIAYLLIFIITFLIQVLIIVKSEKRYNKKLDETKNLQKANIKFRNNRKVLTFFKVLFAFVISNILALIAISVSVIVYLGTDLSV